MVPFSQFDSQFVMMGGIIWVIGDGMMIEKQAKYMSLTDSCQILYNKPTN